MIHDRVKHLRELHKWTHDDMAKKMEISRTAYTKKENGDREFSALEIDKLADLFEVATDYIYGRAEKQQLSEREIEANGLTSMKRHREQIATGQFSDIPEDMIPLVLFGLDNLIRSIEERLDKEDDEQK